MAPLLISAITMLPNDMARSSPTYAYRIQPHRESAPPIIPQAGSYSDSSPWPPLRIKPRGTRPHSLPPRHIQRAPPTTVMDNTVISPAPPTGQMRSSPTPSQTQKSVAPSEDEPLVIPSTTLRRSSHIRRARRSAELTSRNAPAPVITDRSQLLEPSLQSRPPLSSPRTHYPTPSTPSVKEVSTPIDAPINWNPSSYSTSSNEVFHVSSDLRWDSTGFVSSQRELLELQNERLDSVPEENDEGGAPLTRKNTAFIKYLLQERRRRAGLALKEWGAGDVIFG